MDIVDTAIRLIEQPIVLVAIAFLVLLMLFRSMINAQNIINKLYVSTNKRLDASEEKVKEFYDEKLALLGRVHTLEDTVEEQRAEIERCSSKCAEEIALLKEQVAQLEEKLKKDDSRV